MHSPKILLVSKCCLALALTLALAIAAAVVLLVVAVAVAVVEMVIVVLVMVRLLSFSDPKDWLFDSDNTGPTSSTSSMYRFQY